MINLQSRDYCPLLNEIEAYVKNPLFSQFCSEIKEKYKINEKIVVHHLPQRAVFYRSCRSRPEGKSTGRIPASRLLRRIAGNLPKDH